MLSVIALWALPLIVLLPAIYGAIKWYNTPPRRVINRTELHCKWEAENVDYVPYGSTNVPMYSWECGYGGDIDISKVAECSVACPAFERPVISICPKHGEYIDTCDDCMYEEYTGKRMIRR